MSFAKMMNDMSARVSKLQAELAECYRLSGADPDGNEDWRLAESAVDEVRRMRTEFDKMQSEHVELVEFVQKLIDAEDPLTYDETTGEFRALAKEARELLAKEKG